MTATISLSPAGSFEVKCKRVRGQAKKAGDKLTAEAIEIPVKSFETGIELRDEHLKKKLEFEKYPNITVESATASGGQGTAQIKVRDISKSVPFTYRLSGDGQNAEVEFSIGLKEYQFEGISYMGVGVEDKVKITAKIPVK